jgi:hypothetical protein
MRNTISLGKFIKEHKEALDKAILKRVPSVQLTNTERRLWVLNDESLYNWARREGVQI